MAKRDEEDEGDVQSSGSSKHKVIVILTGVGILLLFVLMLMLKKMGSVGHAVYVEQKDVVAVNDAVGATGIVDKNKVVIWPEFSQATVAKDDIITIPLYLMSAVGQEVTAIDMNVGFEKTMLSIDSTVLPADKLPTGEWIGKPIEVAADISAGKQVSLMSNGGMKSGGVFATVSFRVVGSYVDKDILSSVTFDIVKVTGVDAGVKYVAIVDKPKITANVIIVPQCNDVDKDGYGKPNTDQRACGKRAVDSAVAKTGVGGFSDCDDANIVINPGATEVCNGWDDNCNDDSEKVWDNDAKTGVDMGLVGVWNDNLQGVCYGKKLCEPAVVGKKGWVNSYDAKDQTKNTIAFNDGVKSYTQSELFEKALESKCDFFDNNCDGVVNEKLGDCKIGGGGIPSGLLPTGNAFLTYGADDDFAVQKLDNLDVSLLYILKDVRDPAEPLGDAGKAPFISKVKGTPVWVCDSGVYYVFVGGKYETHWYKGKKVFEAGMSVAGGKLMQNGQMVVC